VKTLNPVRNPGSILAFLLLLLPACAAQKPAEPRDYEASTATKPYADVLAELELAITERNFRITGHNKIGSVIREREHIAFPDYDTVQFCNLSLAREMLDIAPEAVAYMPCNATVRTQNGRVHATIHLLPTDSPNPRLNDFARQMNGKLREIVDFAVEN
jgi:uncharacterized protein (DUF302 family)